MSSEVSDRSRPGFAKSSNSVFSLSAIAILRLAQVGFGIEVDRAKKAAELAFVGFLYGVPR